MADILVFQAVDNSKYSKFWDQTHITIVWNTRETGDINPNLFESMVQTRNG